jgi:hypothetical protein
LRPVSLDLSQEAVSLRGWNKHGRSNFVLRLCRMHRHKLNMLLAPPVFEPVEQAALRRRKLEFQIEALCSARDVGVTLRDLRVRGGKGLR